MSDVDTLHMKPEALAAVFAPPAATILDRLCEAGGTATLDDLTDPEMENDATHAIQRLFEVDIVDYTLESDVSTSEVRLAHDTIRVQPLVLDGERPSVKDVIEDTHGDVFSDDDRHELEERIDQTLAGEVADADDVKDAFQNGGDE